MGLMGRGYPEVPIDDLLAIGYSRSAVLAYPFWMHTSLMLSNAPGVIRTHNLLIRSQMLYPVELRVRTGWEG
jgi:hypothetical protein